MAESDNFSLNSFPFFFPSDFSLFYRNSLFTEFNKDAILGVNTFKIP